MQGNKPSILVNEITDVYVRENFKNLKEYFQGQNQLLDFSFFEVTFDKAETNKKVRHNLKFAPTDVFLTGAYGASGSINVGLFDQTNMDISSDGPVRLRFFAGKYWNSTKVEIKKDDKIDFGSISSVSSEADEDSNAGIVVAWPGEVLKKNSLWCDGAEYDAKKYLATAKALWSPTKGMYIYGGSGVYPNGTFKTPDIRGYFIRGLDGGRGVDIGRILGSLQADALQGHIHQVVSSAGGNINRPEGGTVGGVSATPPAAPIGTATPTYASTMLNNGVDGVPRTASETRPMNIALNYIILTK
mgnify:CR=1 FL=1